MLYNNITSAWAVDREFLSIYLVPLASLGCLWGALGLPWGALGLLLGAFGLLLGALGVLWVRLRMQTVITMVFWGYMRPLDM